MPHVLVTVSHSKGSITITWALLDVGLLSELKAIEPDNVEEGGSLRFYGAFDLHIKLAKVMDTLEKHGFNFLTSTREDHQQITYFFRDPIRLQT